MVDFKEIREEKYPDVAESLKHHENSVENHRKMPLSEFIQKVEYYIQNSAPPKWPKGSPVYDATLWHVMIPEMLRRLKEMQMKKYKVWLHIEENDEESGESREMCEPIEVFATHDPGVVVEFAAKVEERASEIKETDY